MTLGSETADLSADTYFPWDGAHWDMYVSWNSGDEPHMTHNIEHLRQDISLWPDETLATLSCPSNGYSLICNEYSDPNMTKGDFYYFKAQWDNVVSGYPADSVAIETRRWKILDSSNWQFPAYSTGADRGYPRRLRSYRERCLEWTPSFFELSSIGWTSWMRSQLLSKEDRKSWN